jgi:hypothetical protein
MPAEHGHFQAAVEWQRHGPEAMRVKECEVIGVLASILLGIVADHDGA